ARVNALISAAVGSVTQAYSAVLSGLAALSPTAFGKSLLEMASAAALRTAIALPTTTTVGRLARYTDAAGAQGGTAGIYEDATGKVGVGTAAPSYTLDVAGFFRVVTPATSPYIAGQFVYNTNHKVNIGAGVGYTYASESTPRWMMGSPGFGAVWAGLFLNGGGGNNIARAAVGTPNSSLNDLAIATGDSTNSNTLVERVRIKEDGKVGIGTSSPGQALDVAGTVNASGGYGKSGTAASQGMAFAGTKTYFVAGAGGDVALGNANDGNKFLVGVGATGLVGIGTSSPAEKLHLNGGSLRIDDTLARGVQFYRSGVQIATIDTSNSRLTVAPSAATDIEIRSGTG
ncbi:MAG: hypothetical protein KDA41_17830, partial [Planctomycetales bacterium]|nr:hypothetical protein [Planctomycetales bacterium]